MTTWFLDASVLLASRASEHPHHQSARQLIQGPDVLGTLDLARYEAADVTIRQWRDPAEAVQLQRMIDVIADTGGLIRVDPALAAHMASLAHQHGLSAYDAAYVAGAARVGATLVSCDLRDLVEPGLAVTPAQACAT